MELHKMSITWPLLISFIRLPLLLVAAIFVYLIFIFTDLPTAALFRPDIATVYFTLVNIACFYLIARVLRREGSSIRKVVGFERQRLGQDVAFGVLWQVVLYLPFMLAVMGTMWFLFGGEMFAQFEVVFTNAAVNTYVLPFEIAVIAAIVSATLFPLLNAPIEEIFYRGYAQSRLVVIFKKRWMGILIPAIGFSLQHIVLAPTVEGAIVYAVAFFVWGIGAGVIYQYQKRLVPLIVAHFITNFVFGVFPLVFILML